MGLREYLATRRAVPLTGLRAYLAKSRATGPGSHGSIHWYTDQEGNVVYGDPPKYHKREAGERWEPEELPPGHEIVQGEHARYLITPVMRGHSGANHDSNFHKRELSRREVYVISGEEPKFLGEVHELPPLSWRRKNWSDPAEGATHRSIGHPWRIAFPDEYERLHGKESGHGKYEYRPQTERHSSMDAGVKHLITTGELRFHSARIRANEHIKRFMRGEIDG